MTYTTFTLTVEERVAHLQFCRPDAYNSMNRSFWREFPAALRQLDEAGEARVLVISGQGKHFCAGMDLEIFTQPDPDLFQGEPGRRAEAMRRLVTQLQEVISLQESIRMPVLAAVQGGCIGGALDLICAADCRYATEDAFFVVKETELGLAADMGTLQRLPGLISAGLARELAYTARKLSAAEAQASGLINRVFASHEALLSGVLEVAAQIAAHSPLAVTGCKQMINYARDHGVADSLAHMATWQAGMFQPTDMMQGFQARAQRLPPDYEPLRPLRQPFQGDQ